MADTDPYSHDSSLDCSYVTLGWDKNQESDMSHYSLYRRKSGGTGFTLIANIDPNVTVYTDEDVEEDTNYDYRIYAVDLSGNTSTSQTVAVRVPACSELPPNPFDVQVEPSETSINILWKENPFFTNDLVKYYRVVINQLATDNSIVAGTESEFIIPRTFLFHRIDDLLTGTKYQVSVQIVDFKDRMSSGVVQNITPLTDAGPRDPENVLYETSQIGESEKVKINLSWVSGDTPYDSQISYRYKIYVQVSGENESLPIQVPVGQTDYVLTIYTLTGAAFRSIFENKLITIRVVSVDEEGFESAGNYIRLVTPKYTLPKNLKDVVSSFSFKDQHIKIEWVNNDDTFDVNVVVKSVDPDDPYNTIITLVDENIGKATFYIVKNVLLDQTYTIEITPLDSLGNPGLTTVLNQITPSGTTLALPLPPESLAIRPGDRTTTLSWTDSTSVGVSAYNIYRRQGGVFFDDTWEAVEQIPVDINYFIDYGLENGEPYAYYVTSVDVYGRESLHLSDNSYNLNFVEDTPTSQSSLTHAVDFSTSIIGDSVLLSWSVLPEEFDSFTIWRSIGNLYTWQDIGNLNKDAGVINGDMVDYAFTDGDFPLKNNTELYYRITKSVNDVDIIVQSTTIQPENSIFIGKAEVGSSSIGINVSDRRDVKDLADTLEEFTSTFLLIHKHKEINPLDPERIDLNNEIEITAWSTVDGTIFSTAENIVEGSSFIVTVDGFAPQVLFEIDSVNNLIIFTEPIVEVDPSTGELPETLPEIKLRILGVEEVQGVLDSFRINDIHARQVEFGRFNINQIPRLSHEGRIEEQLVPEDFLLERYNNHVFKIGSTTDGIETLGNGTTFFSVKERDGDVYTVIDFSSQGSDVFEEGEVVGFDRPFAYAGTAKHITTNTTINSFIESESDNATRLSTGSWDGSLTIGNDGSDTESSFFRMKNTIPRKAMVHVCNLQLEALQDSIGIFPYPSIVSLLTGTLPDDNITMDYSILNTAIGASDSAYWLSLSGESISWNIPAWSAQQRDSGTKSPDLIDIVQPVVDALEHSYANYFAWKIEPDTTSGTNSRDAVSYLDSETNASLGVLPVELTGEYSLNLAEVTASETYQNDKAYRIDFGFADNSPWRHVRIVTNNVGTSANPVIDLKKRIRFWMKLTGGPLYLTLGIREIEDDLPIGADGGSAGPIEWVGASDIAENDSGDVAPIGIRIDPKNEWQEINLDIRNLPVRSADGGNGLLSFGKGVLDHLAFTVVSDDVNAVGPFEIYLDNIEQVDDVLIAGTSQGLLVSDDFGINWNLTRLTATPVHKFFAPANNEFTWALSGDEVLVSSDIVHWYATSGTLGVQNIRDIVEDNEGNMYCSTDKGVYWLEYGTLKQFPYWRQVQIVNPLSTDCYGMFHFSSTNRILTSTEAGIFYTDDRGDTWFDTGNDTFDYPILQFIEVGPANFIYAITRKHLFRSTDGLEFSLISDFGQEYDIQNIWKIAYFEKQLYLSTEKGVYRSHLASPESEDVDIMEFKKVLDGLDVNGQVAVAFGLDVVSLGFLGEELFIGQENKLRSLNDQGNLSVKYQVIGKDIPTFFVDGVECKNGYTYNDFNKVVIFTEPIPAGSLVSSAFLPRRVYCPVNKGWAYTNPNADIFLHHNGIARWIDFKLNADKIKSELSILQGTLSSLPELTTFNSGYPDSQTYLDKTIESIQSILDGDVSNLLVKNFIDNYSRLLSLLSENTKEENSLALPSLYSVGIQRTQREPNSRAKLFEQVEGYEAEDSNAIQVDVVSGAVDFKTLPELSVDASIKNLFSFGKYDNLAITVHNANVDNTGNLNHRYIEDRMEDINTGLPSGLTQIVNGNFIKSAIYLENRHPAFIDNYPVQNIQSKFYGSYDNSWYDVVNSTVDYELVEGSGSSNVSEFITSVAFVEQGSTLWVGSDRRIYSFNFSPSSGSLTRSEIIKPNGADFHINDIYAVDESEVYVVVQDDSTNQSRIFLTRDLGTDWEEVETSIINNVNNIKIINNVKVVATDQGLFYNDNEFNQWREADLIPSRFLNDDEQTKKDFVSNIFHLVVGERFLIASANNSFFWSGNGRTYFGAGKSSNIGVLNKILRFKNITWLATSLGLYNDANTLLSDHVDFGAAEDLDNGILPAKLNDLVAGSDALYCGSRNGVVYRFLDGEYRQFTVPDFGPIHRMLLHEDLTNAWLILVSYDKIKTIDVSDTNGVFV